MSYFRNLVSFENQNTVDLIQPEMYALDLRFMTYKHVGLVEHCLEAGLFYNHAGALYDRETAKNDQRARYEAWVRAYRTKIARVKAGLADLRPRNRHLYATSSRTLPADQWYNYAAKRDAYRAIGHAVAGTVRTDADVDSTEALIDALNTAKRLLPTAVMNHVWRNTKPVFTSHFMQVLDYISVCDACGLFEVTDEMVGFAHNGGEGMACRECDSDGTLQHSECMGESILASDAEPYYESYDDLCSGDADDVCTSRWGRNNAYRCDDRSGWCSEDAYYEYYSSSEDEDEDEDDDGLSGYHSTSRSRFFEERNRNPVRPCLGVELEVWALYRGEAVSELRNAMRWIYERDGSLSAEHGFEIVSPPMGLAEWQACAPKLMAACRDNGVKGYNATDGMYGIHVNIHRRHLSPLQEARIMMFLCAEENANFIRAVAQRMNCYGSPSIDMGDLSIERQSIERIGGCTHIRNTRTNKYQKKIRGIGKYAPINWKDDIAEFRLFQSTTYLPSFLKNLEFVWALVEWTNPATCSGTSWDHTAFVEWLAARPAVIADYPNLVAYLVRDKYVVKNSGGEPIHNTWSKPLLSRMRVESRPERDESKAEEYNPPLEAKSEYVALVVDESLALAA